MSANAGSRTRIAERLPRRSLSGHADPRPQARPTSHSSPRSSPTRIVTGAEFEPDQSHHQSKSTGPHAPPPRSHLFAAIKSP